MEPHAKYALIGFLVVLLVTGMVLAGIWLARPGDEEGQRYAIYFRNQSLSGLQIDSLVTMRGIGIGSVKSVQIMPEDIERVKVVVRTNADTPIKTDTKAIILRNLLTGLAWVELTGSTQSAPLLEPQGRNELPVIPEGQAPLEALQSTVPALLERTRSLLDRANTVLSDKNQQAFAQLLENLNATLSGGEELMKDVSALATTLSRTAESLERQSDKFVQSVGNAGNEISQEIRHIAKEFDGLSRSVSRAAEKLQDPKSALVGPPPSALGPGERGRGK